MFRRDCLQWIHNPYIVDINSVKPTSALDIAGCNLHSVVYF